MTPRVTPRPSSLGPLEGVRLAILGLGESGGAAARLALAKGGDVYASDSSPRPAAPAGLRDLAERGARIELGGHDPERIAASDLIVSSPGIPPGAPVLRELARRGRSWISEPELAVRFHHGSLIAVTGTNGKTTTSALAAHLLEEAGVSAALGGNVGGGLAPAASLLALAPEPAAWWVLELSSFQLAGIESLRPDVAVVTNLAPDHLDRYPDAASYYADKARLAKNADSRTRWVLPAGDEEVTRTFASAEGARYRFDASGEGGEADADDAGGWLRLFGEGVIPAAELPLLGRHNRANALAALLAASLAGAEIGRLRAGLRSAPSLPHRLEPVLESGGVLWVNDSKATNLAAARSAITSLDRPLVLIAGGRDKGEELSGLVRPGDPVRAVVVAMGEAGPRIAKELRFPRTWVEATLADAVARARETARAGDCVLLSPACSSFDAFSDYAARGESFRALAEAGR